MKKILIILAIAQCILGYATDYYVSTTGSNTNPGTLALPFKTIQKAADVAVAGDVVYIRGGEYVASTYYTPLLLYTKAGGTASAHIKFVNYPGETPVLRPLGGTSATGSGTWAVIKIQGSESTPTVAPAYIDIEGLTLQGRVSEIDPVAEHNNLEMQPGSVNHICSTKTKAAEWVRYNGQGIVVTGPFAWASDIDGLAQYCIPHHITIKNCVVKEFPGAGISLQRFDFVTVENCEIANNCWYTIFGSTGLNLYQATKYSPNASQSEYNDFSIKMIGNKVYGNTLKVLNQNLPSPDINQVLNNPNYICPTPQRWDGNGIILDNFNHDQDGQVGRGPYNYGSYPGNSLVANNIVFGNGGAGIKLYTTNYVSVFNNTAYENAIGGYNNQYGISLENGVNFLANNISYNVSNNRHFNLAGANNYESNVSSNPGFVAYPAINYFTDNNTSNDNTIIPDVFNSLKLASNSICIDGGTTWGFCTAAGCSKIYADNDFMRRRRLWDESNLLVDIGAFEYIACIDYLNLGGLADPSYFINEKVNSGERVVARAQKAITFIPSASSQTGYTNGFVADYGSVFTAEIVTCPNANARKEIASNSTAIETQNEVEAQDQNLAFPNPIESGWLNFTKTATNYKLLNSSGIEISKGVNTDKLNVDGLGKGLYLLDLDGKVQKIIIQ